jgi:hypothetical protein
MFCSGVPLTRLLISGSGVREPHTSDLAIDDGGGQSELRLSLVSVFSVISAMISWSDSILLTLSIPNRVFRLNLLFSGSRAPTI